MEIVPLRPLRVRVHPSHHPPSFLSIHHFIHLHIALLLYTLSPAVLSTNHYCPLCRAGICPHSSAIPTLSPAIPHHQRYAISTTNLGAMVFIIKATLGDATRRLTFESSSFPHYSDIQSKVSDTIIEGNTNALILEGERFDADATLPFVTLSTVLQLHSFAPHSASLPPLKPIG